MLTIQGLTPAFSGIGMPDKVPMTTRERACTSPIWYIR
jgi:hypothetical protein